MKKTLFKPNIILLFKMCMFEMHLIWIRLSFSATHHLLLDLMSNMLGELLSPFSLTLEMYCNLEWETWCAN